MKKLIFINGTMGSGKTVTSKELQKMLPNCVFLDGDWCWDSVPFIVTDKTMRMVIENISFLINNFLDCPDYNNIIFCWVMHEQSIIDSILRCIDLSNVDFNIVTLICSDAELKHRLLKDIEEGKRSPDIISRSIVKQKNYNNLKTKKINVSDLSPKQAGLEILSYLSVESLS